MKKAMANGPTSGELAFKFPDQAYVDAVEKLLLLVVTHQRLFQGRTANLLLVLHKLFGLKTERQVPDAEKELSRKDKTKKSRRGRNGRDEYPGADKSKISHETLKLGGDCPECRKVSSRRRIKRELPTATQEARPYSLIFFYS